MASLGGGGGETNIFKHLNLQVIKFHDFESNCFQKVFCFASFVLSVFCYPVSLTTGLISNFASTKEGGNEQRQFLVNIWF